MSHRAGSMTSSALPQIVWDGLGLDSTHSGIGHYGHSLHEALSALGVRPLITSLVGVPSIAEPDSVLLVPNPKPLSRNRGKIISRLYGLKPVFPSISYKFASRQFPVMIYHGLSNLNLPCFVKRRPQDRFVVTIHDLIPLLVGGSSALSAQMRFLIPRVVKISDAIIVPSNWTRQGLLERYGANLEKKIHVIPNGTAQLFADQSEQSSNAKINDILVVSRGESYKRLELISSVASMLPNMKFIVVTDELGVRRMASAGPNLRVFSKVSRQDLVTMYLSSRIFMHTSLYEGWCLPAADALKAGLFTLFVKGSGIEEVCAYAPDRCLGMAADEGPEAWRDAILNVSKTKPSSASERIRIDLPTWQDNAKKALGIYESLL